MRGDPPSLFRRKRHSASSTLGPDQNSCPADSTPASPGSAALAKTPPRQLYRSNLQARSDNGRIRRGFSSPFRFFPILVLLVAVLYVLVFNEYGWVYRRCLVSKLLFFHFPLRLQCSEAWYHRKANLHPGLLWTSKLLYGDSGKKYNSTLDQETQNRTEEIYQSLAHSPHKAASHIHYIFTSPFTDRSVEQLGECSVEAIGKMCRDPSKDCTVHFWVVGKAANEMEEKDSKSVTSKYVHQINNIMHSTGVSYCIRVVTEPATLFQGNNFTALHDEASSQETCTSFNIANNANQEYILRMIDWLTTPLAKYEQLTEHLSDAWRLLVLLLFPDSIYLDLDVMPLDPLFLHLPPNTLPLQHRVGAYRMNSGSLRLGTPETQVHSTVDNRPTYLQALVEDHLHWAPLIAQLPKEQQTFGFVGPAALTRVFVDEEYSDPVVPFPSVFLEPSIGPQRLCPSSKGTRTLSLAAHFSRNRKYNWYPHLIQRAPCLRKLFVDLCPSTMAAYY